VSDSYRRLFELSPRVMCVLDRTTLAFRLVNAAACTCYGWSRDELLAMTLRDVAVDPIAAPIATTGRHRTRDGGVLDVRLDVAYDGDDISLVITDVTIDALHRIVVERSADGVMICNADGTIRYVSPGAERIFGRTAAELVGTPARRVTHPDDLANLHAPPTGEVREYLSRMIRPDGAVRWVATSATNLTHEPVNAYVATFRDVSRRIEAERALRETNDRLEFLLGATSAVTYSARPDCLYATYVSANVREVMGWEPSDYVTSNFWLDHVHPDDRASVDADVGTMLGQVMHAFEYRFQHKNGEWRWLQDNVRLVLDDNGRPRELIGHFVDVTERRRIDESLRRSEASFRTLIERAPTVTIVHSDGVISYANPAACALLGYDDASELVGAPILELISPDDHEVARANIEHTARAGFSKCGPLRIRRKDGAYVTIEGETVQVAFDAKRAHVMLARDVTERNELFTRMAVADRMLSVGTLAAGVAHEINNPLAFVVSNLALLGDELPRLFAGEATRLDRLSVEELLVDAREGAARVSAIVRDLRVLARPDDVTTSAVDVARVLTTSLRMVTNELRHRARLVERFEPTARVRANESRLGQVFVNVLVNAAQAIPEGRAEANEVRVTLAPGGSGEVVVEIEDTGVGIPSHVLGRIFDPFFTTKPIGEGVGLGLAICHQIVASLGGEISVATAVGVGTRIRIALPAAIGADADVDDALHEAPMVANAARVLMIDDEAAVGRSTRALLAPEYDITPVTRAAEGLALLATDPFDAILCDLMMPEMSGMEFWARLAPDHARRVVFLTGGAFTEQARAFLASNAQPRLDKPFREHDLRRAIDQIIGGGGPSR
jgi:two-component system, cell cycle sensor histidine kinase and response regulator CckA